MKLKYRCFKSAQPCALAAYSNDKDTVWGGLHDTPVHKRTVYTHRADPNWLATSISVLLMNLKPLVPDICQVISYKITI